MRIFLISCIIFLLCRPLYSQDYASLAEKYSSKLPQEKLYVQFDNSYYYPGQTIWYKAYLLNGAELSDLSKVLYLDIYDLAGHLLTKVISPVQAFTASGSFAIKNDYKGGSIQIIGYTKWMLNFDSSFLFQKRLPIVNNPADTDLPQSHAPDFKLKFFPESGDIVEGLTSTVAFKALSTEGQPADVKGTVFDSKGKEITSFRTQHDGMGKFSFVAQPNEQYNSVWTDPLGKVHETSLPNAVKQGISFTIDNNDGSVSFFVERQPEANENLKHLTLIVTQNQNLVLHGGIDLQEKSKVAGRLSFNDRPPGIIQITILDKVLHPIAERIIFNNMKQSVIPVSIIQNKVDLSKRGKNDITIDADSLQGSFSVSVTAADDFFDSSKNIATQLLLSSDIKGVIHNPAYYFSDTGSAGKDLDLVMLTNGWRRFAWEDVLADKQPQLTFIPDSNYLEIFGEIPGFKKKTGSKEEFVTLTVQAKGAPSEYFFVPIQKDGNFSKSDLIYYDTVTVSVQASSDHFNDNINYNLHNNILSPTNRVLTFSIPGQLTDTFNAANASAIKEGLRKIEFLKKQTTLAEVTVKSKTKTRINELEDKYISGSAFKDDGISLNVTDDPVAISYPSLYEYLHNQASLPGMNFDPNDKKAPITWRSGGRKGDAITALYVDELQMDVGNFFTINMADVAYIKVLRPPFSFAKMGGPGGAVAVYTKKGSDLIFKDNSNRTKMPVFTYTKQFYSPDDSELNFKETGQDLRSTLFWKPNLISTGTISRFPISFVNNDFCKAFRVVVEGVTADGKLVYLNTVVR